MSYSLTEFKNISFVQYDCHVHEVSIIKKLLSYSLYCPDDEKFEKILNDLSSRKDKNFFLYIINNKIMGLIGFNNLGIILHIAVDPEFRFKGIAKQMVKELSKRFAMLKAETDREGVGFYKACGFDVESLGELYPGTERFKCTMHVEQKS